MRNINAIFKNNDSLLRYLTLYKLRLKQQWINISSRFSSNSVTNASEDDIEENTSSFNLVWQCNVSVIWQYSVITMSLKLSLTICMQYLLTIFYLKNEGISQILI